MKKRFNTTGTCRPAQHYMADVSVKLSQTLELVEQGEYFTINRPRQYGKTTMLRTLERVLEEAGDNIVFSITFESVGDSFFENEKSLANGFLSLLQRDAKRQSTELERFIAETTNQVQDLKQLSDVITDMANLTDKRLILLIDEIDKSSNNELFVHFLAMLRAKYLMQDKEKTFHSVVLAGLHDIKTLKVKMRPEVMRSYNSPWNIAVAYRVNMNLLPHEIKPMLDDYAQAEGVTMDTQAIADELFHYTSGYPYLTSHLCKLIAEDILPTKEVKEWVKNDVYKAFRLILKEHHNANFDSLLKHLREYPDLYNMVYSMLMNGMTYPYNNYDETISLGILHGVFAEDANGKLTIHNRIYRELIAEVLVSEWRTKRASIHTDSFDNNSSITEYKYRLPNNGLDMKALLEGFQEFMRQNFSEKNRKLLERDGRLIFLAYLKPIINGSGYDFKEPQISEERRLDLIITFFEHLYLAELKVWYGEEAHGRGLIQLADYLERLGLDTGYLVIFDNNKKKTWTKDWIDVNGKRIFWVRV
jgi:AAA-like domain